MGTGLGESVAFVNPEQEARVQGQLNAKKNNLPHRH